MMYEPRNFKGRLDEFPQTLKYGKMVDSLRKRYSDWLWDVEYRYRQDADVQVDGGICKFYSVMRRKDDGRRAIVIVNFDYSAELSATIAFEGMGELFCVSPEKPDRQECSNVVTVPPACAIVVFEK